MPDEFSKHRGPSTLWVMTRADVEQHKAPHRVATPLAVAVVAAGLVSAARFGDAALRRQPHAAEWDAIRSYYQDVADWIDLDATADHPVAGEVDAIGRLSQAAMVDFLGLVDCTSEESVRQDDLAWWLSGEPDYWVTAGESVDAEMTRFPEFSAGYEQVAAIGPLTVYRRNAAGPAQL